MKKAIGSFVVLLAVAGCQAPTGTVVGGDVFVPNGGDPIGVRQEAVTQGDGPNGSHIIYLNFDGAPLSRGYDNSSKNVSQIVNGSVSFPAFDDAPYKGMGRTAVIGAVTNYMTQFFAPFNATIVNTRPSSGRYTMCMIGGTPGTIGVGGGAAGIAPLDCGNYQEGNVVYAFANVLSPAYTGSTSESIKAIAVTCAQETAHAFGLGHTTDTKDIMYPQLEPSQSSFTGKSQLQNDGSGQCGDGSGYQDSKGMLLDVLGATTGGNTNTGPRPTVEFVTPADGSTVPGTFPIVVDASEAGGTVTKVEVSSGGQVLATFTSPPFKSDGVQAPQDGMYELVATAYDANGNFQTATTDFTVQTGAPDPTVLCKNDSNCDSGTVCQNGKCVDGSSGGGGGGGTCSEPCPDGQVCQSDGTCAPDNGGEPAPGSVGASCEDGSECASGLCASLNGHKFCTQECDPATADSCPSGNACVDASGGAHICQPNRLSGGSGCTSTPGDARTSGAMLAACLLLACALLFRRRRA